MVSRWRTGVAAASLCIAGAATAAPIAGVPRTHLALADAGDPVDMGATSAEQIHDRSVPPAAEEEAPAAVDLTVVYTAEAMRNARGGLRRGTRFLDNLDVTLTVDAERAFGWRGATLFAYGLYNNGEPFSDELVGAAQGVSNIETGIRAARLYEAWLEQRFASDRASIKFGLYDLNSEFDAIDAAALFLNPSHGIGPDFSQSGRNGPSIFPQTSLALRGDYKLGGKWLVRAAVLDGVPGDPDRPRRTAIRLSKADGALGVVELNYLGDRTKAAIGYWRYTSRFEAFSAPTPVGETARRRGNDGVYAFAERRLTRGGADDAQGLAGWVRLGLADGKLNPVERYMGGGLSYTGPFPGRDEDQIGVAIGLVEFGGPFRRSSALAGDPLARRELIIEATFRAPVSRWLTFQPDVQYVVNPGGRRDLRDAVVVGFRTEIGF